jgi:hypothetical protein
LAKNTVRDLKDFADKNIDSWKKEPKMVCYLISWQKTVWMKRIFSNSNKTLSLK